MHAGWAAVRGCDMLPGVPEAEGPGDGSGEDHWGYNPGHWGWGQ